MFNIKNQLLLFSYKQLNNILTYLLIEEIIDQQLKI